MTIPFLDTDVIIRLVTRDDFAKQAAAASLFREIAAGNVTVRAPIIDRRREVLRALELYGNTRLDLATRSSSREWSA